ncbi:MAG: hypothetical protein IKM43_04340 [Clostridia bacterium]|nr:hypothetical protein [Clostridia bacterium]
MIYKDYQILNDYSYHQINQEYQKTISFDKNTLIAKLFLTLKESLNLCLGINNNINKYILGCLQTTKEKLSTLLDNLSTIHPQSETKTLPIKNTNVFSLTKKLSQCLSLTYDWQNFETKEYNKNIAKLTHKTIIEIISNFSDAFEKSNIVLFKFM